MTVPAVEQLETGLADGDAYVPFGDNCSAPSTADAVIAEIFTAPGVDDPYPLYARLRAEAPVHRGTDGRWYLSSYAACCQIKAAEFGVSGRSSAVRPDWRDHPALRNLSYTMGGQDPPVHTRLRRLVIKAFTARRVTELRPTVETMVLGLLDELAERGAGGCAVDFLDAFAFRLPVAVISQLLGMPPAAFDTMGPLVLRWLRVMNPVAALDEQVIGDADRAATEMWGLIADVVALRRARPADDLLSDLIRVEDGGEHLTLDELLSMVTLLYIAGYLTTSHLLGNALVALVQAPEQAELLRADPSCVTTAIEEFLRYDSPVQINARVALQDVTVGGERIAAGEVMMAILGAAHRDPDMFERPDVLDLRRRHNPHLGFGGGIHYCLGAGLARMEVAVALPALLRRFPALRLAAGATRAGNPAFWGYQTLPIVV